MIGQIEDILGPRAVGHFRIAPPEIDGRGNMLEPSALSNRLGDNGPHHSFFACLSPFGAFRLRAGRSLSKPI